MLKVLIIFALVFVIGFLITMVLPKRLRNIAIIVLFLVAAFVFALIVIGSNTSGRYM